MTYTLEMEKKNASYHIQNYEDIEISADRNTSTNCINVYSAQITGMGKSGIPKLINHPFCYPYEHCVAICNESALKHSEFEKKESKEHINNIKIPNKHKIYATMIVGHIKCKYQNPIFRNSYEIQQNNQLEENSQEITGEKN